MDVLKSSEFPSNFNGLDLGIRVVKESSIVRLFKVGISGRHY